MTIILLVRHGQNEWVQKKRLAGWIPNIHLNDEGKKQALELAERLCHLPITTVYSSPVTRCMETAAYVADALQLEVTELEAVGEVRYGDWEGAEIETLAKEESWHAVQHFPSRFRFPQGEALREVQARAVAALEELSARHEKNEMVTVVSHADLIKLLLAHYLGVHIDLFQRIVISPASVSALALMDNGMVRVIRVNDDGPLQSPPQEEEENENGQRANGEENA
ncbi:MAG TPA: MSMEG_4193 family putative phosphomutase [Candidatus Sulfomarinibacteraceae bacterium]|nr:MSMEG_4193 family putative phosphomutase [Candidatus Sulfomarinibacteraceae bacterium]